MKAQAQFFPHKLTNISVNIVAFSTLLGPKWNVFSDSSFSIEISLTVSSAIFLLFCRITIITDIQLPTAEGINHGKKNDSSSSKIWSQKREKISDYVLNKSTQ